MTKTKALKQLKEYSRNVITPEFASKIAQAFGYTLKDLHLKSTKVEDFGRLNYTPETAKLKAIETSRLANELCYKITGEYVESNMMGSGSYAQDITEKAVAKIS
jgi:hypothetical protein